MPPPNFYSPPKEMGYTAALTGEGSFAGQNGRVLELAMGPNAEIGFAAAACVGPDYTGGVPLLSIRGLNDDGMEIVGANSSYTDRAVDPTGNAYVTLSAMNDWPWGNYPPYPYQMTKCRVVFGPAYPGGSGTYYIEIYHQVAPVGPERPDPPPPPRVPCPDRPPWPYKDPAMDASPQGAGRIRRSRP